MGETRRIGVRHKDGALYFRFTVIRSIRVLCRGIDKILAFLFIFNYLHIKKIMLNTNKKIILEYYWSKRNIRKLKIKTIILFAIDKL